MDVNIACPVRRLDDGAKCIDKMGRELPECR